MNSYEALQAELLRIESQIHDLKRSYDQELSSLTIKSLKTKNDQLSVQIDTCSRELAESRLHLDKMKAELSVAKKTIQDLSLDLVEKNRLLDRCVETSMESIRRHSDDVDFLSLHLLGKAAGRLSLRELAVEIYNHFHK